MTNYMSDVRYWIKIHQSLCLIRCILYPKHSVLSLDEMTKIMAINDYRFPHRTLNAKYYQIEIYIIKLNACMPIIT